MYFWDFDTDVSAERMICSQYLIRLRPEFLCIARAAEYGEPPLAFEGPFIRELTEWLYSYKNKLYIMEREGEIWGFVPTFFASSAMALALKFNVEAGVALRCLEKSGYRELLEYSPDITSKKTRSTKISDIQLQFDGFLEKINECFFEPCFVEDNSESIIRGLEERIRRFSKLTGTPVIIEAQELQEPIKTQGELDLPLHDAFLLTMLLFAREFALDRSVRISFRMLLQSVMSVAKINAEQEDFSRSAAIWEVMCAERLMPFGDFIHDGALTVCLQPCRRELSYLGLKQQTDWTYLWE